MQEAGNAQRLLDASLAYIQRESTKSFYAAFVHKPSAHLTRCCEYSATASAYGPVGGTKTTAGILVPSKPRGGQREDPSQDRDTGEAIPPSPFDNLASSARTSDFRRFHGTGRAPPPARRRTVAIPTRYLCYLPWHGTSAQPYAFFFRWPQVRVLTLRSLRQVKSTGVERRVELRCEESDCHVRQSIMDV